MQASYLRAEVVADAADAAGARGGAAGVDDNGRDVLRGAQQVYFPVVHARQVRGPVRGAQHAVVAPAGVCACKSETTAERYTRGRMNSGVRAAEVT